ncbi:hypothetical protein L484_020135 [Morus notabilis]|uniref:Uncharacterized protein n=1 Tax=Morus notabilis TaxID=981085 RepID=W9RBA8_9ROSA|nr:hypothetical protein L484_020135 [Morus notabilis]
MNGSYSLLVHSGTYPPAALLPARGFAKHDEALIQIERPKSFSQVWDPFSLLFATFELEPE